MKTTAAHTSTPPIAPRSQSVTQRTSMLAAATNLSWQLAVVVIVPIFGGSRLDAAFGTKPVITVIGFALAAVGMGFVVWKQMQAMSPVDSESHSKDDTND